MHNLNASWHRFWIDFGRLWAPRRASKSTQNRLKIDPKTDAQFECILASIFGRFWSVWGPKTGPQIDPKSIKNRSWAPMATPRPPKTHPRPSQDPPKTENRPQIDPKSAQNPPNIDPTSTQHLRRIYMQKLLKIKPLSTKDASIQRYKRARTKRYTRFRTYLLYWSSEFPNACRRRGRRQWA